MTRSEILAHNRGVAAVIAIAEATAAALRQRLRERPTRFNHAIAALDGLIEVGKEMLITVPPDGPEAAAAALPKPSPERGGASAQEAA